MRESLTESQITILVNDVIKKYNLAYPLDLLSFIATLGFEIKYVDTGKSDAYTLIYKGKKVILLNKNISLRTRINFTLAHELGHYFIPHHLEPLYACNVNEIISSANLNNHTEEREADIFASELLLPRKIMDKKSNIRGFNDILKVGEQFNTSIPSTAIKMIEHSYDNVCFICCKSRKIGWFATSPAFRGHFRLNDIKGSPIPDTSLFDTCLEKNLNTYKGKIPAFTWIENTDTDSFIHEEVLYYPKYNTGYILITADNPVDLEG